MKRRGLSHPPRCTTVRDDRQIVIMTVKDCAVTSHTIAQQIQSVTHHSVSARTIRRHLQQWNVRKATIASFTLDWKPQTFTLSMV
ncbi:hypothetical protein TNCV_2047331 [Trichonephila clavipes]|uniref:Transposase Tc1-like domain-containing protein n=1 Tax=Trichonephila clavipes TaxID=2585209 RepID=A0A8X6SZI7_TRICX|nr:hypothetical protein TNCV_2047331 [Trichonephila clavipes]